MKPRSSRWSRLLRSTYGSRIGTHVASICPGSCAGPSRTFAKNSRTHAATQALPSSALDDSNVSGQSRTTRSINSSPRSQRLALTVVLLLPIVYAGCCKERPTKTVPLPYPVPCPIGPAPTLTTTIDDVPCDHAYCLDATNAVRMERYLRALITYARKAEVCAGVEPSHIPDPVGNPPP